MCSGLGGSASRAARVVAESANTSVGRPPAASAVVMKVRAIFCSVASVLKAPSRASSRVKRYQSAQSRWSAGFGDAATARPIS